MDYCIGYIGDFEALNIDTTNLRKSLDGQMAIIHAESVSDTTNFQVFNKGDTALENILESEFSKNRDDKYTVDQDIFEYLRTEDLPAESIAWFLQFVHPWTPTEYYGVGELVKYHDKSYRLIQGHTAQSTWPPDVAVALFLEVRQTVDENGVPVIPDWKQPLGSHDAYPTGFKVFWNGEVYESVIDSNVWSPTGNPAGWKKVTV